MYRSIGLQPSQIFIVGRASKKQAAYSTVRPQGSSMQLHVLNCQALRSHMFPADPVQWLCNAPQHAALRTRGNSARSGFRSHHHPQSLLRSAHQTPSQLAKVREQQEDAGEADRQLSSHCSSIASAPRIVNWRSFCLRCLLGCLCWSFQVERTDAEVEAALRRS